MKASFLLKRGPEPAPESCRVIELRRPTPSDETRLHGLSINEDALRRALMPSYGQQRNLVREAGIEGYDGRLEEHFHAFDSAMLECGCAVSCCPHCGRGTRSLESYPIKDSCHFITFYRFVCCGEFFILKSSPSTVGLYLPEPQLVIRFVDEDESFGQMFFRPEQLVDDIQRFYHLLAICRREAETYRADSEARSLYLLTGHFRPIGHHLVNELPAFQRLVDAGLATRLQHVAEPLFRYFDLRALFPEIGRIYDWSAGREDFKTHALHVFRSCLRQNAFTFHPYHIGRIQEALDHRVLSYAGRRLRPETERIIQEGRSLKPKLWVTLRSGNRCWRGQNEGLIEVLNKLSDEYPKMQVIFDGLPKESADLQFITSRMAAGMHWVNALHCTVEETLYWTHFIDVHMSPVGNGGVFLSLANKPGLYHGSSRILQHYCTGTDGAEGFSLHPRESAVHNLAAASRKDYSPEKDMHYCDYEVDTGDMLNKLHRLLASNGFRVGASRPAPVCASERSVDMERYVANPQAVQRQLLLQYRTLAQRGLPLPSFRETGFRMFSQNDEDGLLIYLFALLGFTGRSLVDIAFGSPYGSNSTNLLCNWGFHGLLVEGDENGIAASRSFFESHPDTAFLPPILQRAWVTAENINPIVVYHQMEKEIDLLSLDVDGVDYWLWKSLTAVRPRVVILEAAAYLGAEQALTVPYRADFNRFDVHEWFCGASIPAFIKLGREKGYRLVACNRFGFNLLFVQEELARDRLPEISAAECFRNQPLALKQLRAARREAVLNLPWVAV